MANTPAQPSEIQAFLQILLAVLQEALREGRAFLPSLSLYTLGLWSMALLGCLTFLRWLLASIIRLGLLCVLVTLIGYAYMRS